MLYPVVGVPLVGTDLYSRYMQYKYIRCLERAGAKVQLLAPDRMGGVGAGEALGAESLESVIELCAGFLFPGGPDIWPALYGQEALPECGKPDRIRDAFELPLLRAALEAKKPLQDIKPKQECEHWDFWHRATATHAVELDPDSLLSHLLGTSSTTVNSIHHQAVDDLGKGLWVAADSPDGFPEALELEEYPFCLGVQWHPEHMAAKTPAQRRLFEAFVKACREQETP